jgi:hypothetical protein
LFCACSTAPDSSAVAADEPTQLLVANQYYWNAKQIPSCGPRVDTKEVMVINVDVPEEEKAALLEQAGDFQLLSEKPIAIASAGYRVQTERSAMRVAANKGCNLLLLGPVLEETARYEATAINASGGQKIVRHLLVHLGTHLN